MKKILVPTDFSDNARHALRVAARIAAKTGARLEVLHTNTAVAYVVPLPEYYVADQYSFIDYNETAAEELYALKRELADSPEFAGLSLETRIEEGFLFAAIRRVAQEEEVDLIVMGTKGSSGVAEFFVGSNTEKVIRTSPCPVLAVPQNSAEFNPTTVVLATTFQPDQLGAFRTLAQWQEFYPFEVKVLYLNNPAGFDLDEDIERALTGFAEQTGLRNAVAYASDNTFNEEASIRQFAQEQHASLIAMGTHQRQGLSHLVFGSLTEDTVNHAEVPVLSIPLGKK
jgi:nucleotide-binding universal stress UspA family protein